MEQLQQWLKEKCAERNLSWREASIGAGLNPGALSAFIGGQRPGLDSCKALAEFFRVSPVLILQLAGHIEESISSNNPIFDSAFAELADAWPDLPLAIQEAMLNVIRVYLDLKSRKERGEPLE